MNLNHYIDPRVLDAAEVLGPKVRYEGGVLAIPPPFPREAANSLVHSRCLYEYLRSPVVAQPPVALCKTLANTDVPLTIADYRQPWPVLGIKWPGELAPTGLTLLWRSDTERLWIFTQSGNDVLHLHIAGDGSIDRHLGDTPTVALSDAEDATIRHAARMAVNLGLLLAHRPHRLTRLPEHVVRNRRHRDPEARRHAQRQAQVVLMRDLDVFTRWESRRPSGCTMPPQFRRGHWRHTAYGPARSLRKLDWIEPYWTGAT